MQILRPLQNKGDSMKNLNGSEIAEYMKENQARWTQRLRSQKITPKLVIIRDNANPVIAKYVQLKKQYGEDIGVVVEDWLRKDIMQAIGEANSDQGVHGIIVQLPLRNMDEVDDILASINPEKDVDGLASIYHQMNNEKTDYSSGDIRHKFESATATAINWLLSGYDIDLRGKQIAIVGHGRLIGRPLSSMWRNSGYEVTIFERGDNLAQLKDFDVIISATGVPGLIKEDMIKSGSIIVDAGTASEGGVLVGDVSDSVRKHGDLRAITPKIGGVGPLTVTALFEHVLVAAQDSKDVE